MTERFAEAIKTICDNYLIETDADGALHIDSRLPRLVDFKALDITEEHFLTLVEDHTLETDDGPCIDWHSLKEELKSNDDRPV